LKIITIILAIFLPALVFAQEVSQTVKGKITDEYSGIPLTGVSVTFANHPATGVTNETGAFSVMLPVGRYRMTIARSGYQSLSQEVLVIAAKETSVNVALVPSATQLEAVEVTATALPADAPGMRSLTIEKTLRIPANFMDPVRVVTAYPGVIAANDQNNSIIVRGNSPNGLSWRLNGLNMINPNHLANAGTLSDKPAANGGGVNMVSAQMLDRTDFYMGSFPARFGNALAGVVDMNLRSGNPGKFEYTAQASLIGLDLSAEGPLGKNENTSFLANYRYSTVGLLSKLGVNFGDEAITFQDLSFHLNTTTGRGGRLSFFGLYGDSENDFDAKKVEEWEEDKDRYDILYKGDTRALGLTYSVPAGGGKLFAGMAYSAGSQERNADVSPEFPPAEQVLMQDIYKQQNLLFSGSIRFEKQLGGSVFFEAGTMADYMENDFFSAKDRGCLECWPTIRQQAQGSFEGILLQPFTNWKFSLSTAVTLDAGLRYTHFSYNNTGSLEPRVNLSVATSAASNLQLAYSLMSQIQSPQVYGGLGNTDLDLTKSHHFDLQFSQSLDRDLALKAGVFYQHLFDVPISMDAATPFSAINLMEDIAPDNLINEGTGENYGVDFTVEKLFFSRQHLMLGGSYYESFYTAADNMKRDTRFNGNYTFNGVYGKEWTKAERNRTINLSTRLLYLGGLRQSPINLGASQLAGETIYEFNDPFSEKLGDYFRLDVRLSFRKDKPGYTRTLAIDIQNLTGQQNEAYRYFDDTQQKVVTKFQLGIIPILVYRIDF
jgi:hypothetical protein